MVPEYGVTLDGVWVPYDFLEELVGQEPDFGSVLVCPGRDVERVLAERGLLVKETRGGVHGGEKLREFLEELRSTTAEPVRTDVRAEGGDDEG